MAAIATTTNVAPKIITIADKFYVFEFTISRWGATSRDKTASVEVENSKGAESGTASVNVHLLGKNELLRNIRNIEQNFRKEIENSLPPHGRGARLVPSVNRIDFQRNVVEKYQREFFDAVDKFVAAYPQLVADAYQKLGDLLDLSKFPKPSRIRDKFSFTFAFMPVPLSDALVAPTIEAADELKKFYEAEMDRRFKGAMDDAWHKLYKGLEWASDILETDANGRGKKLYEASVGKFMRLTSLLTDFNLTGDHQLEAKRQQLEQIFAGRTPEALTHELKESPEARTRFKAEVDSLLSTLDIDMDMDD